jgi:hypothetical protein
MSLSGFWSNAMVHRTHSMSAIWPQAKDQTTKTRSISLPLSILALTAAISATTAPAAEPADPFLGAWALTIPGGAMWSDVLRPGPIYLQGDHTGVNYRNVVLWPVVK